MNETIYGAQPWGYPAMDQNANYDAIGANSEAFTSYDPVTYSSGTLVVAGTTDPVVGVALQTETMASDNETVAKVQPGYYPTGENYAFLMGTNADLTGNATDVGTYYKLTAATTGTVQVDVSSGVQTDQNRVVMIKKVDPANVGGTGAGSGLRQCLVIFVKKPQDIGTGENT